MLIAWTDSSGYDVNENQTLHQPPCSHKIPKRAWKSETKANMWGILGCKAECGEKKKTDSFHHKQVIAGYSLKKMIIQVLKRGIKEMTSEAN